MSILYRSGLSIITSCLLIFFIACGDDDPAVTLGNTSDASVGADTSTTLDASIVVDASTTIDASVIPDTSVQIDASIADVSTSSTNDAGITDAGQAPLDASTNTTPDTGNPGQPNNSQANLYNPEAVIPPQCYTKTEQRFNPCYTCHQFIPQNEGRVNRMDDGDLQGDYGFSDIGVTNHWTNLFVDRRPRIAAISDESILNYINQDNYSPLEARLRSQNWRGWYPDLANLAEGAAAFDSQGFALDDSQWVAFNYMPLPSTFWPTNGSTDDVMIRLPEKFRQTKDGQYSRDIYILNLTAVEAAVKKLPYLSIPPMDERALNIDIDNNGQLTVTSTLTRPAQYFGAADDTNLQLFLYPLNTEFLHTVRYIGIAADGSIYNARRMKEVRYMYKNIVHPISTLGAFFAEEQRDKFEGNLPRYARQGDIGIDNKFGWIISGFIEDANGDLRPQGYEENLFCMGCHTTIGSIIDSTISFPRKVDGAAGWGYINLRAMKDVPVFGESVGAIEDYLRRVGGGNEFRENKEIEQKYFRNGQLNVSAVRAEQSVYDIIAPSRERALQLNKAYKTIVEDQNYLRGRDANIEPATNVFDQIDTEVEPLNQEFRHNSDIRLQWSQN